MKKDLNKYTPKLLLQMISEMLQLL